MPEIGSLYRIALAFSVCSLGTQGSCLTSCAEALLCLTPLLQSRMCAVDGGVVWGTAHILCSLRNIVRVLLWQKGGKGITQTSLNIPFNLWDSSVSLHEEASLTCLIQTFPLSHDNLVHFSPLTFSKDVEKQVSFAI